MVVDDLMPLVVPVHRATTLRAVRVLVLAISDLGDAACPSEHNLVL